MLSPHEIAALLILGDSDHDRELDPADVSTLVARQLVRFEVAAPGCRRMQVTGEGRRVLDAIARHKQELAFSSHW